MGGRQGGYRNPRNHPNDHSRSTSARKGCSDARHGNRRRKHRHHRRAGRGWSPLVFKPLDCCGTKLFGIRLPRKGKQWYQMFLVFFF